MARGYFLRAGDALAPGGVRVRLPMVGLLAAQGCVHPVCHRRVHPGTGQAPLQRWADGWAGTSPPLPGPAQLHEAFLWSEHRTVRKTAVVSLHGNSCQVDPSLAGRRAELVLDPFDLASIEVRWQGSPAGQAIPHVIGRQGTPPG